LNAEHAACAPFFFSISAHVSKELEGRDFDSGVDRVKPYHPQHTHTHTPACSCEGVVCHTSRPSYAYLGQVAPASWREFVPSTFVDWARRQCETCLSVNPQTHKR